MTSVFHILNPSARSADWAKRVMENAEGAAPWALVARSHPQHTETLLDWAVREDVGRIVVWGGDGTFHRVVCGLRERKALDRIELALVPAGTCNDLARRFRLSRDFWRRWEKPVPPGRLASLVIARVKWGGGEDIFVNNAGFGRPRDSFERKDGPLGVLRAFRPLRLSAEWPGGTIRAVSYMLLACSGPYFSGGLHFEKNVSPEEGTLRVYFVPARPKLRFALKLLWGRLGFPLLDGKMTVITAPRLAVETDRPVWPQADGEPPPAGGVNRVEFEVLPERARLWVPA